jgi:hypothetical protein
MTADEIYDTFLKMAEEDDRLIYEWAPQLEEYIAKKFPTLTELIHKDKLANGDEDALDPPTIAEIFDFGHDAIEGNEEFGQEFISSIIEFRERLSKGEFIQDGDFVDPDL